MDNESRPSIPEPMTQLAEGAAGMHECYLAYVRAGFTPDQAMQFVCLMLENAINSGR